MDIISRAKAKVQGRGLRVVLPEGDDARVVEAARRMAADDIARAVLIGPPAQGLETVEPAHAPRADLAAIIQRRREGMDAKVALRLLTKPLYLGGALVASEEAHALVAGAANPTRRVIEAALMTIGAADGVATPSSCFVMTCPAAAGGARVLLFADCAVNANPTSVILADIAIASARSAERLLGETARVALLSFSTHGSAQHADIDKVVGALARIRTLRPDLIIEGELQGDAALAPSVASKKTRARSAIAGDANVLIFPDLDAGNIAYKLVQYLGGATATGPLLQGFAKPVSDLSRGATVDDIIAATIMTLAQVEA